MFKQHNFFNIQKKFIEKTCRWIKCVFTLSGETDTFTELVGKHYPVRSLIWRVKCVLTVKCQTCTFKFYLVHNHFCSKILFKKLTFLGDRFRVLLLYKLFGCILMGEGSHKLRITHIKRCTKWIIHCIGAQKQTPSIERRIEHRSRKKAIF